MPRSFDEPAIAGIRSALGDDVAVGTSYFRPPIPRHSPPCLWFERWQGSSNWVDVGIQCCRRCSCPVEIAADLDVAAALVAASVDHRAAQDPDIVAKDGDSSPCLSAAVSAGIDQAGIYHRGCPLFLALVRFDISGDGVRAFRVKFYSSGFGPDRFCLDHSGIFESGYLRVPSLPVPSG